MLHLSGYDIELFSTMNSELNNILLWLDANCLFLNKTSYKLLNSKRKNSP